VLNAQMPEPVPDVEHQPMEEPPRPTPPVEEPPPGEAVPTSPIPDRLSATKPELDALVDWLHRATGQADGHCITVGSSGGWTPVAPLRSSRDVGQIPLENDEIVAPRPSCQIATITSYRWLDVRSCLAGVGLATLLLVGSVTAAHSQSPNPSAATPPDTQPAPPAEITPSHPSNGRPSSGASGTDTRRDSQTEMPTPLPQRTRPDTPGGTTSNGVARPPDAVDTGINQGAPASGAFPMPIIPPPGTSGGNQAVIPK